MTYEPPAPKDDIATRWSEVLRAKQAGLPVEWRNWSDYGQGRTFWTAWMPLEHQVDIEVILELHRYRDYLTHDFRIKP